MRYGAPMNLNHEAYCRAMETRDARFDGRVFIGVRTTGVYCRPICPARTPKRENVVFFSTAAAAQEAGFRPCLRCRPECSPNIAVWRGTANSVSRALALIEQGALDGGSVADLAERLGMGERHLRRLFAEHIGASPNTVAQTRRIHLAKQLIVETDLPMTEIALASGFGSVRRFNALFRKMYRRPPSALRRRKLASPHQAGITVNLPFAPPYNWAAMLEFLRLRAIPGVEHIDDEGGYHRSIAINGEYATVSVRPLTELNALQATIRSASAEALGPAIERLRRVFDLNADIEAIEKDLSRDPLMSCLVSRRRGLRLPGAWEGFELAVRAILGQQITVAAATKLAGDLVALAGQPLAPSLRGPGLTHIFPRPEQCLAEGLSTMKMPRSRTDTILAAAKGATEDPDLLDPTQPLDEAIERLCELKGIGPWTAQYIAMRALGATDAFPSSDIGILRALTDQKGERPSPDAARRRAEKWRPWRSYAVMHLWQSLGESKQEPKPPQRKAESKEINSAAHP